MGSEERFMRAEAQSLKSDLRDRQAEVARQREEIQTLSAKLRRANISAHDWEVQADEQSVELASLRARLEAAERERDGLTDALGRQEGWYQEACNERNKAQATLRKYEETLCLPDSPLRVYQDGHASKTVEPLRVGDLLARCFDAEKQRDAALRELAEARADGEDDRHWRKHWAERCDAANALLRRVRATPESELVMYGLGAELTRDIDAHLAASPSPAANSGVADQSLASPEGDGAGRECAVVPDCDGEVHDPRVDEDTGQRICRVCDLNMDEAGCLEGGDAHRLGPDDCNGDVYCEDCGELCVPNPGRPSNAEGSGA